MSLYYGLTITNHQSEISQESKQLLTILSQINCYFSVITIINNDFPLVHHGFTMIFQMRHPMAAAAMFHLERSPSVQLRRRNTPCRALVSWAIEKGYELRVMLGECFCDQALFTKHHCLPRFAMTTSTSAPLPCTSSRAHRKPVNQLSLVPAVWWLIDSPFIIHHWELIQGH